MGAPRLRRARVFIMEGLFPQSLTDKIFYNRAFRSVLSTLAVSVRGGTLNDYWNGADDELFYYAKLNIPAETDDDGYVLLAHAEYLTFIPYGEEGYRFFDAYIREKEGVSAAEWRYNVFLKALGKDREAYGEAQLARLRRFLAGGGGVFQGAPQRGGLVPARLCVQRLFRRLARYLFGTFRPSARAADHDRGRGARRRARSPAFGRKGKGVYNRLRAEIGRTYGIAEKAGGACAARPL